MCEPVALQVAEVLAEAGEPTRHLYFPRHGFASLLTRVDGESAIEVGMVGPEGVIGVHLVLGVMPNPVRALVQGEGTAHRVAAADFLGVLAGSPALREGLQHYLHLRLVSLSTSSACLRFHMMRPRLARWLLMTHDRAGADRFRVTHEALAYVLGARRASITLAALALQRDGLIAYRRGEITVLDRPGLESASCSCYEAERRIAHRSP